MKQSFCHFHLSAVDKIKQALPSLLFELSADVILCVYLHLRSAAQPRSAAHFPSSAPPAAFPAYGALVFISSPLRLPSASHTKRCDFSNFRSARNLPLIRSACFYFFSAPSTFRLRHGALQLFHLPLRPQPSTHTERLLLFHLHSICLLPPTRSFILF